MWRQRALLVFVLLLVQQICATSEQEHACPPSSCGKITHITYPFRLTGDPKGCGDKWYELACENNVTVLYLYSGKYHVQAINYNNFTIRVVDPGVQQPNCSSLPRHFLSPANFSEIGCSTEVNSSHLFRNRDSWERAFQHIVFLNCRHAVIDNEKYVETDPCIKWHFSKGYIYAIAGDLIAKDFEVGCEVKLVAPTSWWGLDTNNSSYTQMHRALLYGFELSWINLACDDQCGNSNCAFHASSHMLQCTQNMNGLFGVIRDPKFRLGHYDEYGYNSFVFITFGHYFLPFLAGKFLFGMTLFIVLLIYKWRKRHLSIYENIENYLEQNNLMPIGYSYKEIKKMARGFKEKLGGGGYGIVFKGKLHSGPSVAIKMLHKAKGSGQDFISEIATIGRIHHQNVVQLIGYCVEGSKRALVYEFMPNGSLDKFIFPKDGNIHLTYDEIYNIAIGVARGIAYLHHGCEMKILHFDIKPHNILLDETFTPKVSDFGLAKLYPIDNSIVTRTEARGTIGYMAPELFYGNIGGISHKADVYSFGMLLIDMTNKRKNPNPHADDHSSQLYFPTWIYNQLGKETDIEMEGVTEEEKKMIIVSLWCIQLKPSDRPSMNKVVEMLEGDIESLEIPPKPSLYPHDTMENDQSIYSSQTMSTDFISSSSYSKEIVTNPLVEDVI
ncbi:Rust resistance kinase Lr10 isoform B [Glycine soja]|uniref:Rust resistance kinase Lr10 isoform B n=1 Tax=Glycine soja TaxID=3848 RepID=A0A445HB99_GLYSO|nr:Rust resistance kinase Lr10 isoform B [Glycine soja]